ncbi:galanin receptor 2a-like [Amphiura filiformis]|uniref:galanin receptor 2a-like n=1 Tax=Amphiura filiformis TaxID=82378 RepID=UPI003B21A14B
MENNTTVRNIIAGPVGSIYLIPVPWDWRLIIQIILALTGILGNSLVIHIFLNNKELKKKATNIFIASLAAADLVTAISLTPFPLLSRVPQNAIGNFYCRFVFSSNLMWISIVASIYTLTILAVERYVAVAFPSRYKQIFTIKNTWIIIGLIWLFGIVMNTFEYYGFFVVNGHCSYILPSIRFQMFLGVAICIVEFLIPIVIMLATNCRTIHILNANSASLAGKSDDQSMAAMSLLRARRRVINMLMLVIITFIICWTPDNIAYLMFNLGLVPVKYLFGPIYKAVVLLAFANSCLNPFIYILTNNHFRKALKKTFKLPKRRIAAATKDTEMGGRRMPTTAAAHAEERVF